MNEFFDIGEKIVFIFPVGDLVDTFSMTGDIVDIDSKKRIYFVEPDEPQLLNKPEIWKNGKQFVIPVGFDMVLSVDELEDDQYKWLNKGQELLSDSNCFYGLISTLGTIIENLNGNFSNVALQAFSRLDVSWMEDSTIYENFENIKDVFSDDLISIKQASIALNAFKDQIEQKYRMLN